VRPQPHPRLNRPLRRRVPRGSKSDGICDIKGFGAFQVSHKTIITVSDAGQPIRELKSMYAGPFFFFFATSGKDRRHSRISSNLQITPFSGRQPRPSDKANHTPPPVKIKQLDSRPCQWLRPTIFFTDCIGHETPR